MLDSRVSSKYSCSPEQLAGYIEQSSTALKMRPSVPDAKTHINNQVIEQQEDGEESCYAAFGNMDVIDDMKKLYKTITELDPSMSMPSSDAVMVLLKKLSDKIYEAASEGVCGLLTQELAMEVVNEVMNHELGFTMDDVQKFDAKEYATKQAKKRLNEEGVKEEMADKDYWKKLGKKEGKAAYEDNKKEMLDNMFD